jgi:hypothetical protein
MAGAARSVVDGNGPYATPLSSPDRPLEAETHAPGPGTARTHLGNTDLAAWSMLSERRRT